MCALINGALGTLVPGYAAAKTLASLTGFNFNPVQAALGYSGLFSAGSPTSGQAAAGAASAYGLYASASFEAAGGASSLGSLTELAGRSSFALKSTTAHAQTLSSIAGLAKLGKIASAANAAGGVLSVVSAGVDVNNCLNTK